ASVRARPAAGQQDDALGPGRGVPGPAQRERDLLAARAVMVERHPDGGALQALEAPAVVRIVGRARLPVEARGPRGGAGSGTSRRGGGSEHCGGQGGPQGERGGGRAGGGLLSSV